MLKIQNQEITDTINITLKNIIFMASILKMDYKLYVQSVINKIKKDVEESNSSFDMQIMKLLKKNNDFFNIEHIKRNMLLKSIKQNYYNLCNCVRCNINGNNEIMCCNNTNDIMIMGKYCGESSFFIRL
jgi:hypothetical protein